MDHHLTPTNPAELEFNKKLARLMKAGAVSICSMPVEVFMKNNSEDDRSFLAIATLTSFSLKLAGIGNPNNENTEQNKYEVFLPLSFAVVKNEVLQVLSEDEEFIIRSTKSDATMQSTSSQKGFTKLAHSVARRCLMPLKPNQIKTMNGTSVGFKASDPNEMNSFCILAAAVLCKHGPFSKCIPDFGLVSSDGKKVTLFYQTNSEMNWLSKNSKFSKSLDLTLVLEALFSLVCFWLWIGLEVSGFEPSQDFVFGTNTFQFVSMDKLRFYNPKHSKQTEEYLKEVLEVLYKWIKTASNLESSKENQLRNSYNKLNSNPRSIYSVVGTKKESPFRSRKDEAEISIEGYIMDPLPLVKGDLLNLEYLFSSDEIVESAKSLHLGTKVISRGPHTNNIPISTQLASSHDQSVSYKEVIESMGFSEMVHEGEQGRQSTSDLLETGETHDEGVEGVVCSRILLLQKKDQSKKLLTSVLSKALLTPRISNSH